VAVDWSSFPSDLIAGLLGTAAGLVAGLRIDRRLQYRRARAHDERLVQALIDTLASKRAFSHASEVGLVDDPEDRDRCVASVLDARRRAAEVCDAIEIRDDVVAVIRSMEVDCMDYLNYVESHELEYARALIKLRDRLSEREGRLQQLIPGLQVVAPGGREGRIAEWL
jgi:hypothetical protein